jgi:hypothetical protein
MHRLLMAAALAVCCAAGPVAAHADEIVDWKPITKGSLGPGDSRYFDMQYDGSWANEVLVSLGAASPGTSAPRGEYAQAVTKLLRSRISSMDRSVALAQPPVPGWLIEGYSAFQPRTVAKSRWMNDLLAGMNGQPQANPKVKADRDIAALYAYYCMYDAEWFNASRKASYKAWLTAVQLSYPAQWQRLNREDKTGLHDRLVVPLQTKDEPYREIDNWITALKNNDGGFAKPLVRRSLVEELLQRGGYNPPAADGKAPVVDARLMEDPAYKGAVPSSLGLSDKEFFLLAALATEFAGELNMVEPDMPQLRPFAQYFIDAFEREK